MAKGSRSTAALHDTASELRPAVGDVIYELAHDPCDTAADLRDALAFAPLAIVKGLGAAGDYFAARPRRVVAGALIGIGLLGLALYWASRPTE